MPNITDTIRKIRGFAHLPKGWRFGEGDSISEEKIRSAVRLVENAESVGILRANAFAGGEGELLVSFYIGDDSIEITLEADGNITFAEDCGDEQIDFIENLRLDEAYDKIWQFSERIVATSELYTLKITTLKPAHLRASVLSRLLTAGLASSRRNVRRQLAGQYANTLENSIKIKPASQKSTGASQTKISRTRAA